MSTHLLRISCTIALAWTALLAPLAAHAWVPIRVSVKMILDANGNRAPATLGLTSDADVWDRVDLANERLADAGSEFRVELVEIVDLPDQEAYFGAMITSALIDDIYDQATSDPQGWEWRDDAVNVYINGSTSGQFGGYAKFPNDNRIFILAQNSKQTGFLHELGHNLDLRHTHASDSCSQTLNDDPDWTYPDEISQQNYGKDYDQLTAAQQQMIDWTFFNVMSYHGDLARVVLTNCQLARISDQAYDDRTWMLATTPFYVNPAEDPLWTAGSWDWPFTDIDLLVTQLGVPAKLAGNTVVLEAGAHSLDEVLDLQGVEIVPRNGAVTIDHDSALWTLPRGAIEAAPASVRQGLRAARDAERAERRAWRAQQEAERAQGRGAPGAARPSMRRARAEDAVLSGLERAVAAAKGELRHVIQREIAERHRQSGRWQEAIDAYQQLADSTSQGVLRENALLWIERCRAALAAETGAGAGSGGR